MRKVQPLSPLAQMSEEEINRLYGLDPVFEAGRDKRMVSIDQSEKIRCPHCGECYETNIDISYGSQRYIEDCQVCCCPIEVVLTVENGELRQLQALRVGQ